MPWKDKADVARHNAAAAEHPKKRRAWLKVANKVLHETGDEGRAIREANAVAHGVGNGKRPHG